VGASPTNGSNFMNRAERRDIKEKLKQKRKLYFISRHEPFSVRNADVPIRPQYTDNPKVCSGPCCGNQRKFWGETLAEQKANQDYIQQLQEYEDFILHNLHESASAFDSDFPA
jgi:hypothetical protein